MTDSAPRSAPEPIRRSFRVTGRVQGVAFRAHAVRTAERLGVCGFVRNRPDGAVVGEVQGPAAGVDEFAAWLRQGPPWASVDDVELAALPVRDDDAGFGVR